MSTIIREVDNDETMSCSALEFCYEPSHIIIE